jgi:hypothetical protein
MCAFHQIFLKMYQGIFYKGNGGNGSLNIDNDCIVVGHDLNSNRKDSCKPSARKKKQFFQSRSPIPSAVSHQV